MKETKQTEIRTAPSVLDDKRIMAERREKLKQLRSRGQAFPNDFIRRDLFGDLREKWDSKTTEEIDNAQVHVSVSGRMMLKRVMGKVAFATVHDFTGDIQYFISEADVGAETFAAFKTWDLGDIIAAEGRLSKTNRGELSVRTTSLRLLTKAIRPLPDKFKGLTDPEQCCRQRYCDLIVNADSRKRFVMRSNIVAAIRDFMRSHRFMEVETPMLHAIPGGANARPFITHHNALDMDMYLRIAPELFLKRLVVGGFERVFEINRCFRNEGIDTRHNPEFTTIEFYATYWTYKDQMDFTEKLLRTVAQTVTGSSKIMYQGTEIDLGKPFARLTQKQAILKYAPQYTAANLEDESFLRSELKRLGKPQPDWVGMGTLIMAMFDAVAESKLIEPTYIIDYPVEISPLARASDIDPNLTERFELYIYGRETANGFSELNDPEDQAARFRAQAEAKSHGDDEAMYYDEDFVRALEFGLPPTGGCGVGIDRFVMLLTNASSIRDVILFPTLRPENT